MIGGVSLGFLNYFVFSDICFKLVFRQEGVNFSEHQNVQGNEDWHFPSNSKQLGLLKHYLNFELFKYDRN